MQNERITATQRMQSLFVGQHRMNYHLRLLKYGRLVQ
jgi:hypothetical protein